MTNFLTLAKQRFSVRNYSQQPIEAEKLDYIRQCVQVAPSAVNFQPWHFYFTTSAEQLAKICTCYNRPWMETAPACFIACSDHSASWKRKIDDKDHADIDISIAVDHLILAATEQGLGTCWVCNFDVELCRKLFNIPENLEPCVLIPIGYVAEGTEIKPKIRKDIKETFEEI